MIAHLTGKILQTSPTHSVIDCQGVGYEVLHTPYTAESLRQQPISLHIHTHVREDVFQLFGFSTEDERSLFRELIRVSNVGPKLALSILSGIPAHEFVEALETQNIKRIQKIPGVGKKTAERLAIELKDRVAKVATDEIIPESQETELESVLLNLGYQKQEIGKVLGRIVKDHPEAKLETMVKAALGELTSVKQARPS